MRRGLAAEKGTWRSRILMCQFALATILASDVKALWARAALGARQSAISSVICGCGTGSARSSTVAAAREPLVRGRNSVMPRLPRL
ncbi:hypothetical protein WS71_25520 [Burkholderia mayonis]|uniref:Uncharacterized protein n=1 Tax=Burkholderia mayonis TaxID=1385591 RepID=A0A1B4G3Q1_9BURK|nr:hypothetical protein WS71_25520 [Burkholderia mayonis]KVE57166.1 hypothetical protein WS71_28085 [Burkholderia mayonis]